MLLVMRIMAYPFKHACDSMYKELVEKPQKFWARHAKKGVSAEFKNLIALMLNPETTMRPTMADVLAHSWMRGESVTKEEFVATFQEQMQQAALNRMNE